MNDNGRLKETTLKAARAKLLGSGGSRRIRAGLLTLIAVVALALPGNCASAPVQGDPAPWQYHPNTGHPTVSAGSSWHP